MTMEAFVPPKPNEFEIAAATVARRTSVGHDVEIEARIRNPKVDIGRKKAIAQRQDGEHRLDRAGRA